MFPDNNWYSHKEILNKYTKKILKTFMHLYNMDQLRIVMTKILEESCCLLSNI